MIRNWNEHWGRFFFAVYDPLPVACFRISLGTVMLISLLSNIPTWQRNFSFEGMPGFLKAQLAQPVDQWWSILYWTHDRIPVALWGWLAILLAVGYVVGFCPKICAFGLLLIISGMFFRNYYASNAEDTTFRMYMFYSLLLPVGDRLSMDQWLRSRRHGTSDPSPQRTLWAVRMVQFHVLLIYLISTPTKWMSDEAWRNGDAMYYVLINPMWSRWPWPHMVYHAWPARLVTYGSLLMEGSFPILVWFRSLRRYVVSAMISFHLMMGATLANITFFSIAFSCGLWLFFSADDLRWLFKVFLRVQEPSKCEITTPS